MLMRIFYSPAIIAAALVALRLQAHGSLVLSNLDEIYTTAGPVANDAWIAQALYTGRNPDGYTLDSVQLRMHEQNGFADNFMLSIYTKTGDPHTLSAGETPDASIGQLVGPDPSAGGTFTYTAPDITLNPETYYYIVATAGTPAATGAYAWSATDANDSGNGWVLKNHHFKSPNGADWTAVPRREIYQVAIRATAIPEPSALVLAGIGFCFLHLLIPANSPGKAPTAPNSLRPTTLSTPSKT